MQGSLLPIAVAHGEGYADFSQTGDIAQVQTALHYVDNAGARSEVYPFNPMVRHKGLPPSPMPMAFHRDDAASRACIPYRVALMGTEGWGEDGPWMRMFRNARVWLG